MFVGGPYDGREIEVQLLNSPNAPGIRVTGDLVDRFFLRMPESPDAWDRITRGEPAVAGENGPWYEKIPEERCVLSSAEAIEQAKREANVKALSRVEIAFTLVSAEDKKRVLRAATALQGFPPDKWPADRVRLWDKLTRLYLLDIPPELQAFIRVVGDGQIELTDLFRAETLRYWQEQYRSAGVAQ
jgi:hypothetical protein